MANILNEENKHVTAFYRNVIHIVTREERCLGRRTFIKYIIRKIVGFASTLALLNAINCKGKNTRMSKNWIWITPDLEATDDDWKRRFEKLKKAGFDALLPELYTGRAAYYCSNRLPVKAELLERFIPIARSFDLEIHAWMWTMPCMLEDIQKNHPDWYNINRLGQSSLKKPAYVDYYKFLCPAKEEVHEFIQDTVQELSQYDIDGVHLDYIRFPDVILAKGLWSKYNLIQDKEYPQFDYCYCETCRKKFKEQEGIDPLEIKEPSEHQAWLQFRYNLITDLVNNKLVPIAHEKGKLISAAVFPNWKDVRQEWRTWKLDAVLLMLYNQFYLENAEWIKHHCEKGIQTLQHNTKLYSGLFIDKTDKFKEYVIKSFEGGAKGISVYSLQKLEDEHLEMLTQILKFY